MSKRQLLSIIGIWVMAFLFLGLPSFWHKILAVISGVIIIVIAYRLDSSKGKIETIKEDQPFVDNKES
ncbi:MAG: hypothetical protein AAB917_01875 [Patescibacteria group bacterium]